MVDDDRKAAQGIRPQPPSFRRVAVRRLDRLSPRLVRVTFGGDELAGLRIEEPASSVRLLLPAVGSSALVVPTWTGNRFLFDDGTAPPIRTFTPLNFDAAARLVDLEIVLHPGGMTSSWAESAQPGDEAAISGPGRGYTVDPRAAGYVLAGDETAVPAMKQLIAAIPAPIAVHVKIEIAHREARVALPSHPRLSAEWVVPAPGSAPGSALLPAVRDLEIGPGSKVWAAGEAGAMHDLRRDLFDERDMERGAVTVRGYWKHGR